MLNQSNIQSWWCKYTLIRGTYLHTNHITFKQIKSFNSIIFISIVIYFQTTSATGILSGLFIFPSLLFSNPIQLLSRFCLIRLFVLFCMIKYKIFQFLKMNNNNSLKTSYKPINEMVYSVKCNKIVKRWLYSKNNCKHYRSHPRYFNVPRSNGILLRNLEQYNNSLLILLLILLRGKNLQQKELAVRL